MNGLRKAYFFLQRFNFFLDSLIFFIFYLFVFIGKGNMHKIQNFFYDVEILNNYAVKIQAPPTALILLSAVLLKNLALTITG